MKPITRENIDEDPWFGGQRERVLALLDTITMQEGLIETQDSMLKEHAGREGVLYDALKDLLDRLDVVHEDERYKSVWQISQLHVGQYKGPTYEEEYNNARRLVKK